MDPGPAAELEARVGEEQEGKDTRDFKDTRDRRGRIAFGGPDCPWWSLVVSVVLVVAPHSRASTSPCTLSSALRAFFGSLSFTSTGTLASPTIGTMPTRAVSFLPNST